MFELQPLVELRQLLARHSLKRAPEGKPFTLASGKTSTYYLDVKMTALRAEGHEILGRVLLSEVWDCASVDAVAGVALGGCSLASAVSLKSYLTNNPLPAVYVRKEAKQHGTGQLVESPIDLKGKNVVLLEDVLTTGGSSLKAVANLQAVGANVVKVVAVVDRLQGAADAFKEAGVAFSSVLTIDQVLNV